MGRAGRPSLITEDFIEAIALMQDEGFGTRPIAKALGVSRTTVRKAVKKSAGRSSTATQAATRA